MHCAWLEDDLRPQLQTTSSYSVGDNVAGKGIAAVRIEGGTSELVDTIYAIDGIIYILDRYSPPLMVEQVESVGLQLYRDPFRHSGVLINTRVDCIDGLATFRIATYSQER
jgi:hypothetical protein